MSASLVGSEMCIRDRPWPTRAGGSAGKLAPGPTFAAPGWQSAGVLGAAVSYTHLTLPTICSV
eukprot:4306793-Alexandrium_andersonii.AAC.1